MREQRLVFGEDPELYDRARAGYADAVVDRVLDFAGLAGGVGHSILEVGAGTGKATVAFAARGFRVLALEPSAEMAAVARRNCGPFPEVEFVQTGFEDWPVRVAGFDLVVSAQAWHWVDPAGRAAKAAEALVGGGSLALLWHRTAWSDEPLREEMDEIYRRLVPDLRAANPGCPGVGTRHEDGGVLEEIAATGLFERPEERVHPWPFRFTADGLVALLATQSNHRLLPDDQRAALFTAIHDLVERHGGSVVIPHDTWMVLARRRAR